MFQRFVETTLELLFLKYLAFLSITFPIKSSSHLKHGGLPRQPFPFEMVFFSGGKLGKFLEGNYQKWQLLKEYSNSLPRYSMYGLFTYIR